MKRNQILIFFLAATLCIVTSNICSTQAQNKQPTSMTFKFGDQQTTSNDPKYRNIVWQWVLSQYPGISPQEKSQPDSYLQDKYGFSRQDIVLSLVDLNSDRQPDILSIPGHNYCGSGGCSFVIFLSPGYKAIESNRGIFPMLPLTIKPEPNTNYKSILYKGGSCKFDMNKKTYLCS